MRPYNIISPFPLSVLALAGGIMYLGVKILPDIEQKRRETDWKLFVHGKEEHWKKIVSSYNAQADALITRQKITGTEISKNPITPTEILERENILRQFDKYISERFTNYAMRDKFVPYDVRKIRALENIVEK